MWKCLHLAEIHTTWSLGFLKRFGGQGISVRVNTSPNAPALYLPYSMPRSHWYLPSSVNPSTSDRKAVRSPASLLSKWVVPKWVSSNESWIYHTFSISAASAAVLISTNSFLHQWEQPFTPPRRGLLGSCPIFFVHTNALTRKKYSMGYVKKKLYPSSKNLNLPVLYRLLIPSLLCSSPTCHVRPTFTIWNAWSLPDPLNKPQCESQLPSPSPQSLEKTFIFLNWLASYCYEPINQGPFQMLGETWKKFKTWFLSSRSLELGRPGGSVG